MGCRDPDDPDSETKLLCGCAKGPCAFVRIVHLFLLVCAMPGGGGACCSDVLAS